MTERERLPGERIEGLAGAYVVRAKHGEGSFGVTYLVDDAASGAPYVLKELRLERVSEWKVLELFEREGRTLEALHHPAIPRYRDFFAHDGARPFAVSALTAYEGEGRVALLLVQEYVAGRTLAARVANGGPFAAVELERVLLDLLDVLVYLHALSPPVIHRDISPRNVILDEAGRAHLVDFGAIQDRIRAAGTVGSTTVGTMGFAPLEQMRGDARPSSDLYALGMTLLFAASGLGPDAMPVDEETGKARVAELAGSLSPGARRALDAMVEPIAGRRVASAVEARALVTRAAVPARSSRGPSGISWPFAVGVALLVGGGVTVALVRARPRRETLSVAPPAQIATVAATPVVEKPRSKEPVKPAATSAPEVPATKLTWHPRITEVSGLPLQKGARCTLTALATPGGHLGRIRLVCSETVLYDSADPLEGVSMMERDLGEEASGSEYRAWLAYSDTGTRSGKAQARIDTRQGKLQAFREGLTEYKVTLAVDKLSEPHAGPSLAAP